VGVHYLLLVGRSFELKVLRRKVKVVIRKGKRVLMSSMLSPPTFLWFL
jgi:hypothetical protein